MAGSELVRSVARIFLLAGRVSATIMRIHARHSRRTSVLCPKVSSECTDINVSRIDPPRQAHAILDITSRQRKARKIVALVGPERFESAKRVLEVGCGSGVISQTIARSFPQCVFDAVDVTDNRIVEEGFRFTLVEGTTLPFADCAFDIIVSNHVIEHVGDIEEQKNHLLEIRRILKDGGILYLAAPNRWRLLEAHFRLPLLSWFPSHISDAYVRIAGRGTHYDCKPLGPVGFRRLFAQAGFSFRESTIDAVGFVLDEELGMPMLGRFVRHTHAAFLPLLPCMPTFVYLLEKDAPK